MCATVRVIIEFPQMYKLIDGAGVSLEISDELVVVTTPPERRGVKATPQCCDGAQLYPRGSVSPMSKARSLAERRSATRNASSYCGWDTSGIRAYAKSPRVARSVGS